MSWYGGWAPYVSVAERRANARREMSALKKKGMTVQPVEIEGRTIAKTFWGKAWCEHLESYSDFENRLPRGRTYVRNGSVCHLELHKGKVEAKVAGSSLYNLQIEITPLPKKKWQDLKQRCRGKIGSLLALLRGELSDHVMSVVTDSKDGLFPHPKEIKFKCDCPDWASMCKHIAAALYGIGARFDQKAELLFLLRGVDQEELIDAEAAEEAVKAQTTRGSSRRLSEDLLGDVFGIDLNGEENTTPEPTQKTAKRVFAKEKPRRSSKIKTSTRIAADGRGNKRKKKASRRPVSAKTNQKAARRKRG